MTPRDEWFNRNEWVTRYAARMRSSGLSAEQAEDAASAAADYYEAAERAAGNAICWSDTSPEETADRDLASAAEPEPCPSAPATAGSKSVLDYRRMNFFDDGAGRVYACPGHHPDGEQCENDVPVDAAFVSAMRDTMLKGEVHLSQRHMVAVDKANSFRPMDTCPTGVKVQLLNPGFVAVYGSIGEGMRKSFRGWAPLPSVPDELRN